MNETCAPGSSDRPGAQLSGGSAQLSKPFAHFRSVAGAVAVVLLIVVGASAYSLVKLSSLQANLSHAQRQAAAAENQVSALESGLNTAQSDITILQGTVNGLSSLSAYTSKVCNSNDVYDDNTQQYITAYYPCTDENPNG